MIATTDGRTRQHGAASSLPLDLGAQPMLVATRLQPRDRVLLSTDGLKARDPQRQFIDLPRVLAALTGGLPDEALD